MEILMLLLGTLALAGLLNDSDEDTPEEPIEEDPVDPPLPPISLDLLGTSGADTLEGGAGGDTIRAGAGTDLIYGRDGDDILDGGLDADLVFGGEGHDNISGGWGADTLDGGLGADEVLGNAGNDEVFGGAGDDAIMGGDGDDRILGDNRTFGSSDLTDGDDLLEGNAGNDSIFGSGGLDTIFGGTGDDLIRDADLSFGEGSNASEVYGGDGNDTIEVDGGSTISGGAGSDEILIDADVGEEGVTYITDFEQGIDQLALDIVISQGDEGPLLIRDTADGMGAEILFGPTVVAQVTGGQGMSLNDIDVSFILDQGAGSIGYTDDDTGSVIVANHEDNVIDGAGGDDSIFAGTGNGFLNNFTNYHGGNDLLIGGAGDDYIVAEGGDFFVYDVDDDAGQDTVVEAHTDTLIGGEGDDTLIATNSGMMTGGEGADVFTVNQNQRYADDGFVAPPIVINDFTPGEDLLVIGRLGDFAGFGGPGLEEVSIEVWEDGQGSNLMVYGNAIAEVRGGQSLTIDDIFFGRELALP